MPRLIEAPSVIEAAGNKPKRIEEYAGRVNSGHTSVSVARMQSPAGWVEPEVHRSEHPFLLRIPRSRVSFAFSFPSSRSQRS